MSGPKPSATALDSREKEIKSPIDLKIEELMDKSGLVIDKAERKAAVSKEVSAKIGEQFKGATLTINDTGDLETALKPGLVEALEKNADTLPELKGKEKQFVDQVVGIVAKKINEMLLEKYPELKGKKVDGLMDLSFSVDDKGKIEVVLKPSNELVAALEATKKAADGAAKDAPAAADKSKEVVKEDTSLVDTILASAVLNGTAMATTYGNLRATLNNRVKVSEKELLANADYMKIKAANNDLRREAFVELLMKKANQVFGGMVVDGDRKYALDILPKVSSSFVLKISGGSLSFDVSETFQKDYEKVRLVIDARPKASEAAAIAELKSGMTGWLLKLFGIKTDEQLVKIVRGENPLSYFFGAVCVAAGGKSFGWAKGFWEKGKANMQQNAMTSKYVGVVERAAKTFAGFAGKFKFDKLKIAISKGADDFIKMGTVAGKKLFQVSEGGKGIKLSGDVDLKGKTLRMIVGKDAKVEFPTGVSDVVRDGVKLDSPVKQLAGGMYELKALPKDTYIPDGVQIKVV